MQDNIYYFNDLKVKENSDMLFDMSEADKEFSNIKQYAFDCSFPLAKEYYVEYEKYLMNTLFALQNYLKTKDRSFKISDGINVTLTNYSLFELTQAILNNNSRALNSYLEKYNIDKLYLIQSISKIDLNENIVENQRRRIKI